MSKDFIESKRNSAHLNEAVKQQKQINYFVKSQIQQDISSEIIKSWAERKYKTNDYFLNYVKTIFKTPNFITFYKYLRYPLASSRLINEQVKGQLSRVFFSEDKNIHYSVNGDKIDCPEEIEDMYFDSHIMEWLMFRFNDVVVTDLNENSEPIRNIVSIETVVSIEMDGNRIKRIAYSAFKDDRRGYLYIDDEKYIFYPETSDIGEEIPHVFGKCPAVFVSQYPFDESNNTVVRKSMFTYIRADLEEYDFLKTLQRVTEPNGAFPIITKLKRINISENKDVARAPGQPEPMSSIGSQQSSERTGTGGSDEDSDQQAGTVITIKERQKQDGSIDSEIAKNYINFHYIPTEVLEYIQSRIEQIEKNIIIFLVGSHSETSETSKNELQVSLGYVSKQDKLRELSTHISIVRKKLDKIALRAIYPNSKVDAHIFYGSDFFLETESEVYDLLVKSPNPIESRSLLDRLSRSKNRFNEDQMNRGRILYRLIPYANAADFKTAVETQSVGEITMQLQTRFNYWIDMFEATYGDIYVFWNQTESTDSEKLLLINRLLDDLIKANYEKPENRTVTTV